MTLEKRIYCIEGVWNYGDREVEPSVEPLLDMLRRQDLWAYVRRDCATTGEFKGDYTEGLTRPGRFTVGTVWRGRTGENPGVFNRPTTRVGEPLDVDGSSKTDRS